MQEENERSPIECGMRAGKAKKVNWFAANPAAVESSDWDVSCLSLGYCFGCRTVTLCLPLCLVSIGRRQSARLATGSLPCSDDLETKYDIEDGGMAAWGQGQQCRDSEERV